MSGEVTPTTTVAESEGRRERKKRETREALQAAALRLFGERGFDAVTVEDIAEAVDVSTRTFNRYFARKEDVVIPDQPERAEALRAALATRPNDEPLLESIIQAVRSVIEHDADRQAVRLLQARLLTLTPALQAQNLQRQQTWASIVADHVASRLGVDPDLDPRPRLYGLSTVAVMVAARQAWVLTDDPGALAGLVSERFALLASGL
ncbi:MAG: TetR family transcriptional regulator [Acidimicrobiales bacterium]|nr:TetR family transcriptional regulator [Acidimicrobiales bacterium]